MRGGCLPTTRLFWKKYGRGRRSSSTTPTATMGQGSSSSSLPKFTVARRSSSIVPQNNPSFVDSNPDPDHSNNNESITNMPNGIKDNSQPLSSLKSKSYANYQRSTASLSKIFTKKKWKKRRGSISASFNMHNSDIRVSRSVSFFVRDNTFQNVCSSWTEISR